jgi:hypothetical protein
MTVGEGITILKEFSIVFPLSKSKISCVPVPTSTARIRMVSAINALLDDEEVLRKAIILCYWLLSNGTVSCRVQAGKGSK